ncbi:MAG: hypothetical protein LC808_15230 [Actinobacteria bacterium]|nr:hypothetical protein [Actinomycetota bacterium]
MTKILVGVGLIELGSIGTGLGRLVETLGPALAADDSTGRVLVGTEIAFFGPFGFLVGYLLTRTYLAQAFDYFDRISETVVSSVAIYAGRLEAAAKQLRSSLPEAYFAGPPSNRETLVKSVKESKKVRDLGEFRSRMNILLDTLIGPKSLDIDSVKDKIDALQHRGVLDKSSSRALHDIAVVTDVATEGAALSLNSDGTLSSSVHKILDRLADLQELTAIRFEHHVLNTLNRTRRPTGQFTQMWGSGMENSWPTPPTANHKR